MHGGKSLDFSLIRKLINFSFDYTSFFLVACVCVVRLVLLARMFGSFT